MTPKTRRLLLAFAVLGLGASSWSSYVHYALLTVPGYTSFCDVSGAISCTQAYLSRHGSLWGVPVALGGVSRHRAAHRWCRGAAVGKTT